MTDTIDYRSILLKETMTQLPYVTYDLPGVGGIIKATPEHFEVQEILPYGPCGEGEHVFVMLRRKGWNTPDVARALGDPFKLKKQDIGWGGRKDKHAVATQTFSLRLPVSMPMPEVRERLGLLPFKILAVQRHRNKLKTGHVAGNRFHILLTQVDPGILSHAEAIAKVLRQRGLPNYYGEQRFGLEMNNLDRAIGLLTKRRAAGGKKNAFMVSVLQSALFNVWLKARIERNAFDSIISGDVAQKTDTGGMFVIEDVGEAADRFSKGAIVYTGPIFGYKMKAAADQAALHESEVLQAFRLSLQTFKQWRAPGSRRAARLALDDLTIHRADEGLQFSFTLPSGAYATVVMREFMRPS